MNWVDYFIIAILALSVLVGLWRGLVSEVLALAVWVAAFWLAWLFGPDVAAWFRDSIDVPSVRVLVGYGLCFLAVLLFGALLRFLMHKLVQGTGLSGSDRLLGMFFGLARGVLLVTLAVFLLGFTPFTRDSWWHESRLLPTFASAADWLGQRLPQGVRQYLHPEPDTTTASTSLPVQMPALPDQVKALSGQVSALPGRMAGALAGASPAPASSAAADTR